MDAPAGPRARIPHRWLRGAALVTAVALFSALSGAPALARDLMLDEDTTLGSTGLAVSGWSFTGLTLLSAGYAVYSYNDSQDELDKADKNYKLYKAAGTADDALFYRNKVESHRDDARTAETRANVAIALTLIFAVTAFYSFSPDSAPNLSLTATLDGPRFEWRF